MASIEEIEDELENIEELCIEDKVDALTISVGTLHKKIDRLLAMLDSRENKKMKDRLRIKQKRDEENASQAAAAGKIVVDRSRARCTQIQDFRTSFGRTSCSRLAMRASFCAGS